MHLSLSGNLIISAFSRFGNRLFGIDSWLWFNGINLGEAAQKSASLVSPIYKTWMTRIYSNLTVQVCGMMRCDMI